MDNLLPRFLLQLAAQAPVLLAYLLGMVLAVVFWRRYPGPCAFTLPATGLLFLTSIGQSLVGHYVVYAHSELGWTPQEVSGALSANALIGSFARALAVCLLLTAIFMDRHPRDQRPI